MQRGSKLKCLVLLVGAFFAARPAAAAPPAASQPGAAESWALWNGSFSDGGASPAQWAKEGDLKMSRDTQVFQRGPASLRVDCDGHGGNAFQWIEAKGARALTLHGFIRTAGEVKAQVAVQPVDANWSKNQWLQIKFQSGESDWQRFDKTVELPQWTTRFRVLLNAEGKGSAWIDEVSVGDEPPRDARTLDPAVDEPTEGKPWEPAWCIWGWRGAWVPMHEAFAQRTRQGHADIIFYGDSITMGWKDHWQDVFAPLKAVNYGIGGDSTRQLLWRIGHGEVDGAHARLVVLMIGTNNLYGDKNAGTDEEIARGVAATVALLREKLPDAKILLCGILPRQNEYFCNRIKAVNRLIKPLADGKTIRYLDMHDVFMREEPGKVKEELFSEKPGASLHPNEKGYAAMAEVMTPIIREMLQSAP